MGFLRREKPLSGVEADTKGLSYIAFRTVRVLSDPFEDFEEVKDARRAWRGIPVILLHFSQ
jgi:hypothetical protein